MDEKKKLETSGSNGPWNEAILLLEVASVCGWKDDGAFRKVGDARAGGIGEEEEITGREGHS